MIASSSAYEAARLREQALARMGHDPHLHHLASLAGHRRRRRGRGRR